MSRQKIQLKKMESLITPFPPEVLARFEELNQKLQEDVAKAKENIIKEVLKQVLKREITIDDARKTTLYFYGEHPFACNISYDKINLGVITFATKMDHGKIENSFVFIPESQSVGKAISL